MPALLASTPLLGPYVTQKEHLYTYRGVQKESRIYASRLQLHLKVVLSSPSTTLAVLITTQTGKPLIAIFEKSRELIFE
jgi:hypothetical protein